MGVDRGSGRTNPQLMGFTAVIFEDSPPKTTLTQDLLSSIVSQLSTTFVPLAVSQSKLKDVVACLPRSTATDARVHG